ncbi:hypothetical protein [Kineococcus sp. SYSU DK003]|uniref:hypothetical protein n=1 Tax=Kineococcus sp. SYSU DK003 TaxID=3383124 RepID=UPI003D7D6456
MTLFVSLVVILLVAAVVGRVCAKSRPGDRHGSSDSSWPAVFGGEFGRTVELPDTGHHSGWGHAHSHSHSHDGGGWGGDSSGGGGGD